MSSPFQAKVDYCDLSTVSANLVVKDSNLNGSAEKYQPQGQDGSFLTTVVYGEDSAPANNYGLSANISVAASALKLNKIKAIGVSPNQKNYALESVTISTAAAAAPTIAATCQEVESSATDANQCHYSIPAFSLTTKQHAQILFSAFTLSGNGCSLTKCDTVMSCTINKDKVAGEKISSDANSGVITVSGEILQTGDTVPTITAGSDWVVTKPVAITEVNGETNFKTYSFELQKVLAKDAPQQQQAGQ